MRPYPRGGNLSRMDFTSLTHNERAMNSRLVAATGLAVAIIVLALEGAQGFEPFLGTLALVLAAASVALLLFPRPWTTWLLVGLLLLGAVPFIKLGFVGATDMGKGVPDAVHAFVGAPALLMVAVIMVGLVLASPGSRGLGAGRRKE